MNKYVPRLLPAEEYARMLTSDSSDQLSKYESITTWISKNVFYDYIKATRVAKVKGIKPDPLSCWEYRRGICQDIASLTVIMLRAAGIRSYLCIGHAGSTYHAWVQAYIGKKVYRYDHDNRDGKEIKYRIERTY